MRKVNIHKKRKYAESYLGFGFTWIGDEDNQQPKCVVCNEVLANSCMKPSLLIRHQARKHPTLVGKSNQFFKNMQQPTVADHFNKSKRENQLYVEASYKISYNIAKSGKGHTIGETLVYPCIKDAVQTVLGDESVDKISNIPLSNSTVHRRIDDMSQAVELEVITRLQRSAGFVMQVDESTDVANLAILLVIVRYMNGTQPEENLLLCHPLEEHTKAADIFGAIDSYFSKHQIKWGKLDGVATDGAKSMSGRLGGFRALVAKVAPQAVWTHCCIHRQNLACSKMPANLREVLDESVKIINFIKAKSLNCRLFRKLCQDFEAPHDSLLLHTEVRWLSRGKALNRLFELHREVQFFLKDHPHPLADKFNDFDWLARLAYLADIFASINKLNLSLQNRNVTVFDVNDKIEAMIKKIVFWKDCLMQGRSEMFEQLHDFVHSKSKKLSNDLRDEIENHLCTLKVQFRKYFPEPNNSNDWISNPFEEQHFEYADLDISDKAVLIDLSTDTAAKRLLKEKPLLQFWAELPIDYQKLSAKAIRFLLPFTSTELVESAFSAYAYIKNKYRNRLNAASDIRLYLSNIVPDFAALANSIQGQGSH